MTGSVPGNEAGLCIPASLPRRLSGVPVCAGLGKANGAFFIVMSQVEQSSKRSIGKKCMRLLFLCGAVYIMACLGCASFQRRLIYFPSVHTTAQVDEFGAAEKLERWKSSEGDAIGWKRLSPVRPAKGTVVITHGNACCAYECSHFADSIQAAAPLDVCMVEYPGYADCAGKPSETSIYAATRKAIEDLTNRPIYLVGESLGTGVAAYLAGEYPEKIDGIALFAPYPCLADVAQAHVRIFPVRWILSEHFSAEDNLKKFHGPIAVLVGGKDRVVPCRFGRQLFERYEGRKRLWEFAGMNHYDLMWQPPEVWAQIMAFWRGE